MLYFFVLLFSAITMCSYGELLSSYSDTLYAPWREAYLKNKKPPTVHTCVFCDKLSSHTDDEKHFIIKRLKHHALFLNLFPYTKGHLLIVPFAHVTTLNELCPEARLELIELLGPCVTLVQDKLNARGANIGINIGRIAGASIPDHIHTHIVPRYEYERAFIQITADTQLISYDLPRLYYTLKKAFDACITNCP